jgi:hypothetical protein
MILGLIKLTRDQFIVVDLFINLLKSPRSLNSKFKANCYTQNTKVCRDMSGMTSGADVHRASTVYTRHNHDCH